MTQERVESFEEWRQAQNELPDRTETAVDDPWIEFAMEAARDGEPDALAIAE